jgi:hypothetical protein
MTYRVLPAHLHAIADHAREFFVNHRGVTSIVVEAEVEPGLNLRPTLHGRTRDHHTVCVEVTDSGYTDALDRFVLDCQHLDLPIKLYVAVPTGLDMTPILRRAIPRGVGVLEIGPAGGCDVFVHALSLSLTGIKRTRIKEFPMRYRGALSSAADTFLGGDPVKGCGRLYDEIEDLTRRLAKRCWQKGLLPGGGLHKATPMDFGTAPWKNVLDYLRNRLNYAGIPTVSDQLLARLIGITPFRNQAGHKIARKADLVRRDRQLRTRFDDGLDVLGELIVATRSLRL